MNAALILAGAAMGVVSSPHCALMCGAPCAAITGGRGAASIGFHVGRVAGYTAAGAVAAASVAALGTWTRAVPALQPLWLLVHLGFLLLGLWWLCFGAMPARMLRDGSVAIRFVQRRGHSARASLAGLAWVAWPCGALQGALLLAALADGMAGGALVMMGFALASLPGLGAAPWIWRRLQSSVGSRAGVAQVSAIGYRLAGLTLAASSAFALAHGLRERLAAFCAT
jgi:sulfite exporter TauE/SafE